MLDSAQGGQERHSYSNATLSGLTMRLSRYLKEDPYVKTPKSNGYVFEGFIGEYILMETLRLTTDSREGETCYSTHVAKSLLLVAVFECCVCDALIS